MWYPLLKLGGVYPFSLNEPWKEVVRMEEYRKEEDNEEYFPEGTIHEDEFFYTGDYNFV